MTQVDRTGLSADELFVLDFLDMWDAEDVDGMLACFTPDGSYIDMPLPPRNGKAEIDAYIRAVFGAFAVRIETFAIASKGSTIFTERVDHLTLKDGSGKSVPLPVTGVMELRDGKIHKWREYLDLATAERGLGLQISSTEVVG